MTRRVGNHKALLIQNTAMHMQRNRISQARTTHRPRQYGLMSLHTQLYLAAAAAAAGYEHGLISRLLASCAQL